MTAWLMLPLGLAGFAAISDPVSARTAAEPDPKLATRTYFMQPSQPVSPDAPAFPSPISVAPAASGAARRVRAVARWQPLILAASARFAVPADWIERVICGESAGMTTLGGRPITSPKGAMGLMQLMPATWADMRRRHGLGHDPFDPRDNILAGTAYLRAMYDRFGYPGLFGAYNAGPARFSAWQDRHRPLPAETRAYLATMVDAGVGPAGSPPVSGTNPLLFIVDTTTSPARSAPPASSASLFAIAPTR